MRPYSLAFDYSLVHDVVRLFSTLTNLECCHYKYGVFVAKEITHKNYNVLSWFIYVLIFTVPVAFYQGFAN